METQEPMSKEDISNVTYRHFDSDDVARIRSVSLKSVMREGKEELSVDMGQLMKANVCLGVKSAPWFSDVIDERIGVTSQIFDKRMAEFRKIPVSVVDTVFKEATAFNKLDFNVAELKKN